MNELGFVITVEPAIKKLYDGALVPNIEGQPAADKTWVISEFFIWF